MASASSVSDALRELCDAQGVQITSPKPRGVVTFVDAFSADRQGDDANYSAAVLADQILAACAQRRCGAAVVAVMSSDVTNSFIASVAYRQ